MADITLQEAYNRAKEALEAGDVDRAIAICQHMLRYYPHYVEGYRLLGEAYLEQGGLAEAGQLFSHVLSCDPQNVLGHVGRAIIAEEQRHIDVAIHELERGFEVDPSIGELRAELLRLYRERYGTAGAVIHTTPVGLAYTHLRAGLLEPAIAEFSRICSGNPIRWDCQVALLECLWRNEQLIDAAHLATDILRDHPNCVKANWILGYLHWTQGKMDSGREYLTAAVGLDPDYGSARKLWANTPWPLDPAITTEQVAPIASWARGELVAEDLSMALSLPLGEEPLAEPARLPAADLTAEIYQAAHPAAPADVPAEVPTEPPPVEAPPPPPAAPPPPAVAPVVLAEVAPLAVEAAPAAPVVTAEAAPAASVAAPTPAPPALGDWFASWASAALAIEAPPPPAPPPVIPAVAVPPTAPPAISGDMSPSEAVEAPPITAEAPMITEEPPSAEAAPIAEAPAMTEEPPSALGPSIGEAAPADTTPGSPLDAATTPDALPSADQTALPVAALMPPAPDVPLEDPGPPAVDIDAPTLTEDETPLPPEVPAPEEPPPPAGDAPIDSPAAVAPLSFPADGTIDGATSSPAPDDMAADVPPEPPPSDDNSGESAARSPVPEDSPPDVPPEPPPVPDGNSGGSAISEPLQEAGPTEAADYLPPSDDAPGSAPLSPATTASTPEDVIDTTLPPAADAPALPVDAAVPTETPGAAADDAAAEASPALSPPVAILRAAEPSVQTSNGALPTASAIPTDPVIAVPDLTASVPPPNGAMYTVHESLTETAVESAVGALPDQGAAGTATLAPVSDPAATTPDATPAGPDLTPHIEALTPPATKENAMAPSYKEDDDEARRFEFDWEREGLPDYLKPFLAEENSASAPATPPGSGYSTPSDPGLPDWLSSSAPGSQGAVAGGSDFGIPPTPPAPAGAGSLDQEGLPDWLRGTGAPTGPAAPPPTSLDQEGLPSWLQMGGGSSAAPAPTPTPPAPAPAPFNFGNMDQEGLPSWLQPGTPPAPGPMPQGSRQDTPAPFDFGQMGDAQPFDFGAPSGQSSAGDVQPFDFGAPPSAGAQSGLGNIQPFDFGAPAPGGQSGLGNIQPFDFGAPGAQGGNVQPFDFGTPTAPAGQGGLGNVQPFDFGAPASGAQGGFGTADPFDFGAPAAPGAQGGNVQPFDFGAPPAPGAQGGFGTADPFDFGAPSAPGGQNTAGAGGSGGFNMDQEGLPSWLQSGTSPAGPSASGGDIQPFDFGAAAAPGNAQPFDFSQMGGLGELQPFDFGAPAGSAPSGSQGAGQPFDYGSPAGDLGSLQPFDFGGQAPAAPGGNLGGVQPFDFGAPSAPVGDFGNIQPFDFGAPPSGQAAGPGNVQPFDFGSPANDFGGAQPFDLSQLGGDQSFDFGAPSPAPGGLSNIQPFDFGAAPAPAQPGGLGNIQPFDFGAAPGSLGDDLAELDDVDDFIDFLNASEDAPTAGPASTAPMPGGVQPFSLESMNLEPTGLPQSRPSAGPSPADMTPFNPEEFNFQPFAFGLEAGGGSNADLGLPPGLGAPGGGIPGMEGLPDIQPFSFDDLHLGAADMAGGGAGAFGRRSTDRGEDAYPENEEAEERPFSWQQRPSVPSRRAAPEEDLSESGSGESIFAKARRRKEELEAALRQEAAAAELAAAPVPSGDEPVDVTDLWPTFDEEGGAPAEVAAQGAGPAMVPTSPAGIGAADTPASPLSDEFDFPLLDEAPEAQPGQEFDMNALQPFDFTGLDTPATPEPFDFASLDAPTESAAPAPAQPFDLSDLGATATAEAQATFVDTTPGQPEQLWSTPVTPAEAVAPGTEIAPGEYDFTGLPQFDMSGLGLSPEEQAYLLNEQSLGTEAETFTPPSDLQALPEAAPVPTTPAGLGDQEGLPSWLTGGAVPPPSVEAAPSANLDSEPLPSWLGSATTAETVNTPPAWPAPPAEPTVTAEVFGGDEELAWPAPAEPAPSLPVEEPMAAEAAPVSTPVPAEPAVAAAPETPAPTPAEPVGVTIPPRLGTGPLSVPVPSAPEIRYRPEPQPQVAATTAPQETVGAGPGESVEDLQRHLDANPQDAAARLVMAGVYEEREDYRRAMEQYRLLIKVRNVPGNVLDIVIENLRDLVETLPDDPAAHRLLGDSYRKAGMYQAAISQYNWLLTQDKR